MSETIKPWIKGGKNIGVIITETLSRKEVEEKYGVVVYPPMPVRKWEWPDDPDD